VWAVAAIAGPVVAGLLSDHVGAAAPWVLNIALCGTVVGWAVRSREPALAR
jgi:MFS family permease